MDAAMDVVLLILKVTCVLLIALCATLAMQRASAGSRHLVWLTALGALLIVPVLAAWKPLPLMPALDRAPAATPASAVATGEPSVSLTVTPPTTMSPVPGVPAAPSAGRSWSIGDVLRLLGIVWAVVAVVLLGWLARGAWQVRRIVARAEPMLEPGWQAPLYEIADRLGLEDAPRLVRSEDVMMPFAAGVSRPTIVLPASSAEWSAERRTAVLIHELAHVKRRDLVGHTMGRIACAIYWFHPMVWSAARHLRAESERACDDLALAYGTRPSEYAEHLLDIVTCVRDHATPSVALAMAHRNEFEGRMLAILNPDLSRTGMGRLRSAALVGVLAVLALTVAAAGPARRAPATPSDDAALTSVDAAPEVVLSPVVKVPERAPQARPQVAKPEPAPRPALTMAEAAKDPVLARQLDSMADVKIRALAKVLRTDPDASVRRVAAWGLQAFAEAEASATALVAALNSDTDPQVQETAAWALADARPNAAVRDALGKAARQGADQKLQKTAVWALGSMEDDASMDVFVAALASPSADVRSMAAWAIGSAEPAKAPVQLVAALQDQVTPVRRMVIWALYSIDDASTLPALEAAFAKETDAGLRRDIVRAMGTKGDAATEALTRLVSSDNPEIRAAAVSALSGSGAHGPWPMPLPWPRPFP